MFRFFKFFTQSNEGKLYHPDADLEIMDEKVDDVKDDNTDDDNDDSGDGGDDDDTKDDDGDDKDDDKDDEDVDEDKKDDEEESEEDEDDTEEEEEELDSEDDTEIVTEAKEIKAKYPEFFKEFPDVKNALFRAQAYSSLFGTIKDAEAAKARSESLAGIEQDLLVEGDPTRLLDVIEKGNKEALEKISFKILPYLQEKNKELYFEVAALPIKQLLRSAYSKGGKDDKGQLTNLAKAALVLHDWFFENQNLTEKVKAEGASEKKETDAEKEYKRKIDELNTRQAKEFGASVDNSYIKRMDNYIREGLDKDERLSDYAKGVLVREILAEIKAQLEKDSRYMTTLESLHKQARANEYTNDFKSRIVSTALARAKSLVPELRKKHVSQMLGTKKKNKDTDEKPDKKVAKFSSDKRKNNDSRESKTDKSKSDLDILREA